MFKHLSRTSTKVLVLSFAAGSALAQSQRTQMIDGELFRDPTQPPVVASALSAVTELVEVGGASLTLNSTDYVVSFIRTGGRQPVAVVNNIALTIGDEVEGARVVDIRSGEVVLAAENQEFVLTTFSRPVREPVQ